MERVHVGMGGWDIPPFEKVFYPQATRGFRKLRYYSQFFDSVEINATFYSTAFSPDQVLRWLDDVDSNPRFIFTVKLYRGFTHTYDADRKNFLTTHRLLDLLRSHGKFGGLVMQFPYSFVNGSDQRRYLMGLARSFGSFRLFTEVRHNSWDSPLMFNFFQENGMHLVNVDLPQIRRTMPFHETAWGGASYYRLMGRNAATWEQPYRLEPDGRHVVSDRYLYLYESSELERLAEAVKKVRKQGNETFVVFHNDPDAQSLLNGFQFRHMLTRRKVMVPDRLLHRFPRLGPISVSVNVGHPLFSGELPPSPRNTGGSVPQSAIGSSPSIPANHSLNY